MTLAGLVAKNLARGRSRTALTVAAIVTFVFVFVFLQTLIASWDASAPEGAAPRVYTRQRATLMVKLPRRYADEVRAVPGVQAGCPLVWFGGHVPGRERQRFANFAVEPQTFFDVFGDLVEVSESERRAWLEDRQGALIGEELAEQFGWRVGDRVFLESGLHPNTAPPWSFTVRGIYHLRRVRVRAWGPNQFFFHYDYLNQGLPLARRDEIGFVASVAGDGVDPAALGAAIDARFADRGAQTLTQDEFAFQRGFFSWASAILTTLRLVSALLLGIMALVLGNAVALGVRERRGEYALLHALGFGARPIVALVVGEAMAIAALGGALGLGLSLLVIDRSLGPLFVGAAGSLFPRFEVPGSAALAVAAFVVATGAVASALPARSALQARLVRGGRPAR